MQKQFEKPFDFGSYITENPRKEPDNFIDNKSEYIKKIEDQDYFKRVKVNYKVYDYAPLHLQKNYLFCMEALYSCSSYINNLDNKNNSRQILISFLYKVRNISGIMFNINERGVVYCMGSKNTPKRLSKTINSIFKF